MARLQFESVMLCPSLIRRWYYLFISHESSEPDTYHSPHSHLVLFRYSDTSSTVKRVFVRFFLYCHKPFPRRNSNSVFMYTPFSVKTRFLSLPLQFSLQESDLHLSSQKFSTRRFRNERDEFYSSSQSFIRRHSF